MGGGGDETDGLGLEVTVCEGAFGLPSWSPRCLGVLLYMRMADISSAVLHSPYPYSPSSGPLPSLRQGAECVGAAGAFAFLRRRHGNLDSLAGLSRAECVDVDAYLAMLHTDLHPAVQYLWWCDERNYKDLPWKHYARGAPFPLDCVLPFRERRRVRDEAARLGIGSTEQALAIVRRVYAALETRLGDARFFFGARPSTLDAQVAAYVAVHTHSPLAAPAGGLAAVVAKEFPELERHCDEVLARFCPSYRPAARGAGPEVARRVREAEARDAAAASGATPEAEGKKKEEEAEEEGKEAAAKRRSTIQSVAFVGGAIVAMTLYRAAAASARSH